MKHVEKGLKIVLVLAVLISLYSMDLKVRIEAQNRGFEICMSYAEIETLSRITQNSPEEVLSRFKDAGLTSLAIEDTTLRDEADWGKALILNGWQFINHESFLGVGEGPLREIIDSPDFSPASYYVLTRDPKTYEHMMRFLPVRGFDVKAYVGDIYVIQEVRGEGYFSDISLGFNADALDLAGQYDLDILLHPKDLTRKSREEIEYLWQGLEKHNIITLLPQHNRLPQGTLARTMLIEQLKERGALLGFDEFLTTDDMHQAIEELDYSTVRVYHRPAHKFMEEYLLAVRDRNDRVLYLRPFLSGHEDLIEYNAGHISEVNAMITSTGIGGGYSPGSLDAFDHYALGNGLSFLCALGILWAIWKLTLTAGFGRIPAVVLVLLTSLGFGTVAHFNYNFFRDVAGLMVAVIFPVLGIYGESKRIPPHRHTSFCEVLKCGASSFTRVISVTALGAIILAGIYGNIDSLLGITKFRGIKLLYIIGYVAMVFLFLWDVEEKPSLKKPVLSLGGIIAIMFLSGVLFILITRSGNESVIPIPKWELIFRGWMENAFWVRPRTKEFLVGFPALMLAGGLKAIGYQRGARWSYMVALSGTLSMMNTFSHFHNATMISVLRSAEGVILGMALGVAALGGVYLYEKRKNCNA